MSKNQTIYQLEVADPLKNRCKWNFENTTVYKYLH